MPSEKMIPFYPILDSATSADSPPILPKTISAPLETLAYGSLTAKCRASSSHSPGDPGLTTIFLPPRIELSIPLDPLMTLCSQPVLPTGVETMRPL